MKGHHTLIFLFLALQDRMSGVFNEELPVHTGSEGGNVTVLCNFQLNGHTMFFCRNRCEKKEETLIETTKDREQKGRYSIEYYRGGLLEKTILKVTIRRLKKSDSGVYSCGLKRYFLLESSDEFELRVIDASTTSKPSETSPEESGGSGFFLVLSRVLVLMVFVSVTVILLLRYKNTLMDFCGLNSRRNSDLNMERVAPETCSPASTCEDPVDQNIHPAIRDQDQSSENIYVSVI
ncbi:uncharacterized protein LOC115046131 [Echeneis naucrates]|uniref:uncharacterized protein LOC115046131 n=1 Tax=Echeneis naucrates TaxID=173247 RepID=UPI001113301F|nr:uncharacterized protein LOC115046131 [Echeneis naucrates]XP_029362143.1 uncharacterized protein LOC115046131 [Echeneis naucrates]